MADLSDVEQALANTLSDLVYPQSSSQSSIVGVTCRIYRGWPNTATLNADLNAGVVNITIIPDNEFARTTTRYIPGWQYKAIAPALTATVVNKTILVGGSAAAGNVIGALIDGNAYSYRVATGDTPVLVAANLGAIIQTRLLCSAVGLGITIPGARSIVVRVVCDSVARVEERRQEKDLRIIFWCPAPAIRDSLAAAVDLAIAKNAFLPLQDDTYAHVRYKNSTTSDQSQNALLYRRDLIYCVEYPTLLSEDLPSMLFGAAAINGQVSFG